jgi:signal transduction histidine kinase
MDPFSAAADDRSLAESMAEGQERERTAAFAEVQAALEREIIERRTAERKAHRQLEALTKTLRRLATTPDRDRFIEQILEALIERTGVHSGSFWTYDPAGENSVLIVTVGDGPDSAYESLPEEAFSKVEEPALAGALIRFPLLSPADASTLIRIPLYFEKEILGNFLLYTIQPYPDDPIEAALLQALAHQAVPVIRLTHQAEQSRQEAMWEERNRLACEIHDALAQHFAGILLQIGLAQRIVKQQPDEAWHLVVQAGALARTAVEEARRSVWALQPIASEYSDLARSLTQAVAQMTAGTPVQGEVRIYGTPRLLPPDMGMNLLRIGQEAINNALRHAQAQHIFVELAFETARVRLCIQDDGQGFEPQNQGESGGFGLTGMRQRVERLQGSLTISSKLGQGTEVAVTVATGMESAPRQQQV